MIIVHGLGAEVVQAGRMALMPVPHHAAIAASRMALYLREAVGHPAGRLRRVADAEQVQQIRGYRRTRVPFLNVVTAGHLVLPAAGQRPEFTIGAGDAVLFAAGTVANVEFPEAVEFLRVTFDTDLTLFGRGCFIPGQAVEEGLHAPLERLEAHVRRGPRPVLVEELLAGLDRWGRWELGIGGAVDALLLALAESLDRSPADAGDDQRYRAMVQYIADHAEDPLTRDGVAAVFHLSGGHLTRILKAHGARGFQALLVHQRVERARELLAHSDVPLTTVAARCGFADANYLGQAFRRAEGCSPRAWRQARRLAADGDRLVSAPPSGGRPGHPRGAG